MILLPVELGLIARGQMPVVLRAHIPLFFVQPGFFRFQVLRLARRQLSAVHAVGDPRLLIILALLDFRG
jgi:hypothetical protein